jgi:hypothetical protein
MQLPIETFKRQFKAVLFGRQISTDPAPSIID